MKPRAFCLKWTLKSPYLQPQGERDTSLKIISRTGDITTDPAVVVE